MRFPVRPSICARRHPAQRVATKGIASYQGAVPPLRRRPSRRPRRKGLRRASHWSPGPYPDSGRSRRHSRPSAQVDRPNSPYPPSDRPGRLERAWPRNATVSGSGMVQQYFLASSCRFGTRFMLSSTDWSKRNSPTTGLPRKLSAATQSLMASQKGLSMVTSRTPSS